MRSNVVSVNGKPVMLPLKEFDLPAYLMRNTGRLLTRGQLIDRVWGVHVKGLRSKIEADPGYRCTW
jgi:two-component system response regulator RegX3